MADGIVQVPPDSTGKKVDGASLDVGANSVIRQRMVIADNSAVSQFATVTAGALLITGVVSVGGTVVVSGGTVGISGTASVVVGAGTANIGGVSLVAGTANIGFINNISATVNVVCGAGVALIGAVSLAAGTANIGMLNGISATVVTGLSYVIEKTSNSQVQVGDSANAAIRVNIVAGAVGGSGGTSTTDGGSFDVQTTSYTPVGGIFDDAATGVLSENDAGVVRITSYRAMHTNLRDNTGTEYSASNPLPVKIERQSATVSVVLVAGAANIGSINNISATINTVVGAGTANIGGVSLVAGTANIGFINNISATVVVSGVVTLGAGATNIGTINNISATVSVVNAAGTALMGAVSLAAGTANIGLINNISATVTVAGSITIAAGTANIGTINGISATISVVNAAGAANIGGVSLVAGTANIGFINNISATVNVVVGAGTANIGSINNISASVGVIGIQRQVDGTSLTLTQALYMPIGGIYDDITATSLTQGLGGFTRLTVQRALHANMRNVAGNEIGVTATPIMVSGTISLGASNANIGVVNNISATVTVAGIVTIGTGANNIGSINNISATVVVTTSNAWVVALPSASHGPRMVQISTSATATLIAAPGAGNFVYITSLSVTNGGTVDTSAQVGWSGSPQTVLMYMKAGGGGFVMNFDPPWKVMSNETVTCRVDPASSGNCYFNVNYFVSNS